MATITIPSPSSFTPSTVLQGDASYAPVGRQTPKAKNTTANTKYKATSNANSPFKPKQTKSRNGCHTCKRKRLKCDETKPKCEQCRKRGFTCEGYHKIFQWRPEEKATFRSRPVPPKLRKNSSVSSTFDPSLYSPTSTDNCNIVAANPSTTGSPDRYEHFCLHQDFGSEPLNLSNDQSKYEEPYASIQYCLEPRIDYSEAFPSANLDTFDQDVTQDGAPELHGIGMDLDEWPSPFPEPYSPHVFSSPLGPLLPVSASESHPRYDLPDSESSYAQAESDSNVEKVIRPHVPCAEAYPSPSPTASSFSSGTLSIAPGKTIHLHPDSAEMLLKRFDLQTCGILSIKDGPGENPWRTIIRPLASQEPALYYSILSLAAFHAGKNDPMLHMTGVANEHKAVQCFRRDFSTMRPDAAVATTLVLAFCESWDSEINTGIAHLRGARRLIMERLNPPKRSTSPAYNDVEKLKFLYNTWVYMDVLARITAVNGEDDDLEHLGSPVFGPQTMNYEIDPLLGCATSLFPIIGDVANLARKVRHSGRNSELIVAWASDLRSALLKWKPPPVFDAPGDESVEVEHSLRTAEAYRLTTLIYLYQCVPYVCTCPESPAALAEEVLFQLAAVPVSSQALIIHIYPLFIAGCEAVYDEQRIFVAERWAAMISRMTIGNIDRCWDVVREVWRRRDGMAIERQHAGMLAAGSPGKFADTGFLTPHNLPSTNGRANSMDGTHSQPWTSNQARRHSSPLLSKIPFDPETTVRGKLHWVAVMKERNWEILLG